jgi:hypothetical protein
MAFGGAIVLVACADDTIPEKYPSAEAFCTAKATEECKVAAAPCAIPDATCQTKRKDACNAAAGGATGQGRTYKSANAEACITKTTAVYADRVINPTKEEEFRTACEKVFVGTKKQNEGCVNLYDCEGEFLCDPIVKVCARKVDVQEKGPCANPGDQCVKGLYCQQQGATKFCVPKNKTGDSCKLPSESDKVGAPCLEEIRCNASFCVDKIGAGGPCDNNDECSTSLCVEKKCAAKQYASETGTCKDFGG